MPATPDSLEIGWAGQRQVRLPLGTIQRHALVTGTTGYGKSGLLLSVQLGLLRNYPETGIILVDPKGETSQALTQQFLPALGERLPGMRPNRIVTVAPFGRYGVPLNPCARIVGLPIEVQAYHVCTLVGGLVEGFGQRMTSCLAWITRGIIEAGGSFADLRQVVSDDQAAGALAGRVADPEVRDYLVRILPTESRATRDAIRARIEYLLLLPCLRAMLCAEGSISGSDLIEAPVALVDTSGSPLGLESTAQFVSAWIFTLLTSAALTRPVGPHTHPVILAVEEWHRVAATAAGDLERLLSQVRHRKVGLWLANQTIGQISGLNPTLFSSLLTNISVQALFRPSAEDLRHLDELLPVTGKKVNPLLPDQLLSKEEERRRYKAMLAKLPPRQCLLVDRVAGTAGVISTLSLPFDEAARRYETLPAATREAWCRGRFGVPIETLLLQARSTLPLQAVAIPPVSAPAPKLALTLAPILAEVPDLNKAPSAMPEGDAVPSTGLAPSPRAPKTPKPKQAPLRLVLP